MPPRHTCGQPKKCRPDGRHFFDGFQFFSAFAALFSQDWFATPQLVLHADWQEVWHSPQPPFFALWQRLRVFNVLILFITLRLRFFGPMKYSRNPNLCFIIPRGRHICQGENPKKELCPVLFNKIHATS
jgi:hypothetical protein